MSVTRMARAPTSYSSSMIRCTSSRSTIACTATQPSRCSGETVGDSMPGVSATGRVEQVGPHVVGEHHVAAGHQHALQAAQQLRRPAVARARRPRRTSTADESQQRLADGYQAGLAQRGAGLDHVGDHVGHAEADRVLHRAVEPDHRRP